MLSIPTHTLTAQQSSKLNSSFKSDQHLISPYINAAESFIMMMRIKEMISNLRNFDY